MALHLSNQPAIREPQQSGTEPQVTILSKPVNSEERAFGEFLQAHRDTYRQGRIDDLRAGDFARLDRAGHVYLDYTGSGLYAERQVRRHAEFLASGVYGNPHSLNPTSRMSTEAVDGGRRRVLDYFRADPRDYDVVFTSNASHALKVVAEAYPFEPGDQFFLTFDNHNSVNGIREFARARGAATQYVPVFPPDLRGSTSVLESLFERAGAQGEHRLFAYPAQSNFSGVQHPLEWIAVARAHRFDVLLDAAAFVPTNRLDLSHVQPDFVTLSFYKMFGYPTGIGALIARHDALARLNRPWFAGGTIDIASVQADRFRRAPGAAGFEDGTPDFLGIPAVEMGLDLLASVDVAMVHDRVQALTAWWLGQLSTLTHRNGQPLIRLYGPHSIEHRGGTLAFNLADRYGVLIDHAAVDERASAENISLRTGCFCNPGAGELAFGLARTDITACLDRDPGRMTYDDFRRCIDPKAAGAVRASLGIASNFHDAWRFVQFLRTFLE